MVIGCQLSQFSLTYMTGIAAGLLNWQMLYVYMKKLI